MTDARDHAIESLLTRGVTTAIDIEHLRANLTSGKKLRVKFGIDPTGTIVHLGHMVPVLKLKAFQDLGHQVVLIIGDATAQVGDTSDKDGERPMLKREQTRKNAENWLNLFGKVLDIEKTELRYNSEWMDSTNFNAVGELAANFSVAEMLDRDNFSKRHKSGIRISLQEFLYPVMQGWDSVQVKADVELGGNDQYFNLLAGRVLQAAYGQEKQDVLTFETLIGADGKKMAKTGANCIAIDMPANEMYLKIMEVKDELIELFFNIATLCPKEEIAKKVERITAGEHPKIIKAELATEIVSLYHSKEAAQAAQVYFEKVVADGILPTEDEMENITLSESSYKITILLKEIWFATTTGDAKNMVIGGGIRINGNSIDDIGAVIELSTSKGVIVQSGKKKFKLVYTK